MGGCWLAWLVGGGGWVVVGGWWWVDDGGWLVVGGWWVFVSLGQSFVKLASKGRIIGFFQSSSSYSEYILP